MHHKDVAGRLWLHPAADSGHQLMFMQGTSADFTKMPRAITDTLCRGLRGLQKHRQWRREGAEEELPDILDVNGLFQADVVPASPLIQAELQEVGRSLGLMGCQNQEPTMIAILINSLSGHRMIRL